MKEELQGPLLEKYKEIFGAEYKSFRGFETGDGWHDLIDTTLSVLNNIRTRYNPPYIFYIVQIKEKFGRLRIYTYMREVPSDVRAEINGVILMAYSVSQRTCEVCGAPKASLRKTDSGYYFTACEEHKDIK